MLKVDKTITITAKPERVWQAMTSEISKWWVPPYFIDAKRARGLTIEPQLGGHFVEKWDDRGAGYLIGYVVEWLPPYRLAFTWMDKSWQGVSTMVRVELEPDGMGARLTLVHEGFERLPNGETEHSNYNQGWADLLSEFKDYVEKR